MIWIKIALRNIFKNGRRSVFTVVAIGVGFAAVNVFGGFQAYVFQGLQDAFIYAQAQGHVAIFKNTHASKGSVYADKRELITVDETAVVDSILSAYPEVILVTRQLQISGLLSNGDESAIFVGLGRIPSHVRRIRNSASGFIRRIKLYTGKPLKDDLDYGIGLSAGLADKLNVGIDSDVIAMGPTVDGQINAMDAKVMQLFASPAAELNDKQINVPLAFAQALYDTESVHQIMVLLDKTYQSHAVVKRLNDAFAEKELKLTAVSWEEIAPFYTKVRDMFVVIFWFLFVIVLIIVVMSVVNTMSMAVMERIGEIGTIRSMGVKQRGVMKLFAIESAFLGIFGSLLGLLLTILSWFFIKIAEFTWIPPHITIRVPIEVYLVPWYMISASLVLIFLSFIAALFPARKAAGMNIVDALGHT